MEKTVQIIIPVYNAAKTLPKCLDSLLAQTFTGWEAVLVDDASPDNSAEIIKASAEKDARFTYIRNPENGGASKARNRGLAALDAEYVAFLDADDWWEPEMLQTLYRQAKETDADVVQCRFIYDFPDGQTVLPRGTFKKNVFLEGRALRRVYLRMMTGINMNHVCMKLIRREVIEGLLFDTTLPTAEDLEFSVHMFKKVRRYCFVTDVLYHYCRFETSLTGRGLPFSVRLSANRRVARVMLSALPAFSVNTPWYRFLTKMRPYIIIVSKIFRILREKCIRR